METLIIGEQAPFNKIEGEPIVEKPTAIEALSYLEDNKLKVGKIIIKNLPKDGIQLTALLNIFIYRPTLIHNVILFLADTNIDFSVFDEEIKQIEDINGNNVKTGQIENEIEIT